MPSKEHEKINLQKSYEKSEQEQKRKNQIDILINQINEKGTVFKCSGDTFGFIEGYVIAKNPDTGEWFKQTLTKFKKDKETVRWTIQFLGLMGAIKVIDDGELNLNTNILYSRQKLVDPRTSRDVLESPVPGMFDEELKKINGVKSRKCDLVSKGTQGIFK